jgi:hypothetical protein
MKKLLIKGSKTNLEVFIDKVCHSINYDGLHGIFTEKEWKDTLEDYELFSKLSNSQKKEILTYLQIHCGFAE